MPKMIYPDTTPTVFSGARKFVEDHGHDVWCELCDTVPVREWFTLKSVAPKLTTINKYKGPERYLRAVLKAVIEDYRTRPDAYEHRPPVEIDGLTMRRARV